jgi:hypothetical protein
VGGVVRTITNDIHIGQQHLLSFLQKNPTMAAGMVQQLTESQQTNVLSNVVALSGNIC